MNFPGNILDKVSRIFNNDLDEILIYAFVFLFFFLSGTARNEDEYRNGFENSNEGIPLILIAVFLLLTLNGDSHDKKYIA